jgi:hypothetical protein
MTKSIRRVWTFASDSNPALHYETLQYDDGSTSCNCKGWTRRVAPDGSRSCKHTRLVDMGAADRHCTDAHHYNPQLTTQHPKTNIIHAQRKKIPSPRLGHRKFAV